jgi:hypothetical protein
VSFCATHPISLMRHPCAYSLNIYKSFSHFHSNSLHAPRSSIVCKLCCWRYGIVPSLAPYRIATFWNAFLVGRREGLTNIKGLCTTFCKLTICIQRKLESMRIFQAKSTEFCSATIQFRLSHHLPSHPAKLPVKSDQPSTIPSSEPLQAPLEDSQPWSILE